MSKNYRKTDTDQKYYKIDYAKQQTQLFNTQITPALHNPTSYHPTLFPQNMGQTFYYIGNTLNDLNPNTYPIPSYLTKPPTCPHPLYPALCIPTFNPLNMLPSNPCCSPPTHPTPIHSHLTQTSFSLTFISLILGEYYCQTMWATD